MPARHRTAPLFTSWRAFCLARLPFGLGYDPDALDAVVKERMTAQERGENPPPPPMTPQEAGTLGGRGNKAFDNIKSFIGGTSADYLTARIARDRPDILERMKAGEYSSVRQAALDAG